MLSSTKAISIDSETLSEGAGFDALAEDESKLMRQYERFDGSTFARCLRAVRRKWAGLLVTDNASQHKHREVRKYPKEHDEMEILYLSTTAPKLSAVKSVWKDAKHRLVTSEHHETLEELTYAVSECFRTDSVRLGHLQISVPLRMRRNFQ